MHRPTLTALVAATALAVTLSGCSGSTAAPVADAAPVVDAPTTEVESSPTTEAAPTTAASPTTEASPTPTTVATKKKAAVASYDVVAVQRQLADLGYYLGPADGRRGGALRSAVMAFQKVQGLGVDGTVGASTLQALAAPKKPVLKGGPSNRIEVDLTKQVLYVVKGGAVLRILPVSSGNGATYEQKDGSKARALTPTGHYRIQRRIVGVREADLGTLYDPQYFYRGWAIHGSNSVPAREASHGCVRVTRADAKWLLKHMTIGMPVHLYGGRYTFKAGSSAPGTDAPTGDTSGDTTTSTPAPKPKPASSSPKPSPTSSPKPASSSPKPSPTSSPKPSPSPSASASPE